LKVEKWEMPLIFNFPFSNFHLHPPLLEDSELADDGKLLLLASGGVVNAIDTRCRNR
jgi:hypothetical protein